MNIHSSPRPVARMNPLVAFFVMRWRGFCPLGVLFWRDMLIVGTAINIASTLAALVLLGLKVWAPLAIAVHFMTLPYSLFLVLSVWKTTERSPPATASATRLAACGWLLISLII